MTRLTNVLRRLRAEGDEGSALILALIITVTLGLLLGSALTFAGSSLSTTPKLRDQRNQLNYAQGTVDGAINFIRSNPIAGSTVTGQPLCSANDFATYTAATPPLAAGQDSGADGSTLFRANYCGVDSGSEPGDQAPVFAIQTLGTGDAPNNPNCNNPCPAGINQSTGTNNTLSIDGAIYSAGRIWNKGSGGVDMEVTGSVYAAGTCSGTIHSTDAAGLHCGTAQSFGADPQYTPGVNSSTDLASLISIVGVDPAVTCPNNGHHVAYFSPGYYSEQPVTLLKDSQDSDCNGSEDVWWFQPGFYYFDFTNAQDGHVWNFRNGTHDVGVVGGTPTGTWNTQSDPTVPWGTACDSTKVSNTDSRPSQPGVQFIFGGNSTITIGGQEHLELCGPSQSQNPNSSQSIALFGLNSNSNLGTSTPVSVTDESETATAAPTSTPSGATGFVPAAAAQTIDGVPAVAAIAAKSSASLNYSDFTNIPQGATVTSLKVHISRTLSGGGSNDTVKYVTPNNPGGSATVDVPNSCNPCDFSVPVPNTGATWREVNGLSLTYTAKAGNSADATDNVDGITLLVSYTLPALEPLHIGSGNPYFIDASDQHTSVLMHGTLYTPSGGLDVEGEQNGQVIFSRGVIVSTLLVDSNPSFTQTAAPFQTPGNQASRLVKFIGSVSTDGGSSWTDLVQACVSYGDNNSSGPSGPSLPGYTLTVKGWTVLRSSSQQAPTCA